MTPIENIMKLADEYADAGIYEPAARLRQALRAAIEQALTPGEPVALLDVTYSKRSGMLESYAIRKMYEGAPSGVYAVYATAPQLQREWVGLSGEEVTQQCRTVGVGSYQTLAAAFKAGVEFANAKLREKNGGGV
jgi:hypothetical protein